MVAWYWLIVIAWVAGSIGLLVGVLCAATGRFSQRDYLDKEKLHQ